MISNEMSEMSESRRCVQPICELADTIHVGEGCYSPMESIVDDVPIDHPEHIGVYVVSPKFVLAYIEQYRPIILRHNKTVESALCRERCEFKGLGFDRVLILPTEPQKRFIAGDNLALEGGKTDKARNLFYVAITRARYSVAIMYDGKDVCKGIAVWESCKS